MKKFTTSLAVALCLFLPAMGNAQFNKGTMMLGPHIGLGQYGSSLAFGAKFETGVTAPGQAGPGVIGIGARVDYFGYDFGYYKYTFLAVLATANYHFKFGDGTWDPYLGLGLGYLNVSTSYSGSGTDVAAYGSGVQVIGNAGIRYFFSRNLAMRLELGSGLTYAVLGIDFGI